MIYRLGRILTTVFFAVAFRLRAIGLENIPMDGAVMLCSNHISNFDPPLLATPVPRMVHFMAKAELFEVPLLGPLIRRLGAFPVKRGGVSKESIKLAIKLLRDGSVMGIFPEGSRNNASAMGKKGAASLAIRAGAAVVPLAIIGDYKLFRQMTVVYGKPLDMSEFAEGTPEQVERATECIMNAIRELKASYAK